VFGAQGETAVQELLYWTSYSTAAPRLNQGEGPLSASYIHFSSRMVASNARSMSHSGSKVTWTTWP
jgi:hypothetical protein